MQKSTHQQQTTCYRLRLYNADRAAESALLAHRLKEAICAACEGPCEVEVINVLERPAEARDANVFATPMLVKDLPEPIKQVLGNLSDTRRVLMLLDIIPKDNAPN